MCASVPRRGFAFRSRHDPTDDKLCIGCKMCMMVCPYGAIKLVEHEGRTFALKCNLCMDHPEGPSCVRVCTTDAICVMDKESFLRQKNA